MGRVRGSVCIHLGWQLGCLGDRLLQLLPLSLGPLDGSLDHLDAGHQLGSRAILALHGLEPQAERAEILLGFWLRRGLSLDDRCQLLFCMPRSSWMAAF